MHPISRRAFLATGVVVVVAACSDSYGQESAPTTDVDHHCGRHRTRAGATTTEATTTTTFAAVICPRSVHPWCGVRRPRSDQRRGGRVAPKPVNGGGMPGDDVDVTWEGQ